MNVENTVSISVAELSEKSLDWAVAIAEGYQPFQGEVTSIEIYKIKHDFMKPIVTYRANEVIIINNDKKIKNGVYSPSNDEARIQKIKTQYQIDVKAENGEWVATCKGSRKEKSKTIIKMAGKTKLEAICKVFVAHKLGETASIPEAFVAETKDKEKDAQRQAFETFKFEINQYSADEFLSKFADVKYAGVSLLEVIQVFENTKKV